MKNYNIGFCVLRIVLSFCVVLIHFGVQEEVPFLLNSIKSLAVPAFMIISFYLNKSIFICNRGGCYKRIKRLIIPYLLWPVIYFICYFFIDRIFHLNYSSNLSALLWQLALGSSINPPLWFLAVLILLTVFFFSIFKLFNIIFLVFLILFIT